MYKSIAIDGPAGAGKSTISKKLAEKIGFNYLDTGAMYRSYTYYFLKNKLDINDEELVNSYLDKIVIKIKNNRYYMDGEDISEAIRTDQVSKNVSLISSYEKVREDLVAQQRKIANESNIILDGRDIGSHVLKDASMKFFLTAKPEERARRRYEDIKDTGVSLESVLKDIEKRDHFDSTRKISPLVMAEDAILIDSTDMEEDEVVNLMIDYLEHADVI